MRSAVPPTMWPKIRRRLAGDGEGAQPVDEEENGVLEPDHDSSDREDFDMG